MSHAYYQLPNGRVACIDGDCDFPPLADALREPNGLLAAAAIGYLCKHNATLAGAEGGCQAEIGVASAMGAAFLAGLGVGVWTSTDELASTRRSSGVFEPGAIDQRSHELWREAVARSRRWSA